MIDPSHPSLAWRPDLDGARRRLTERMDAEGAPWPDVAAAAVVARGAAGLDRASWAAQLQVLDEVVEAVEAGTVAADEVPASLRFACGLRV